MIRKTILAGMLFCLAGAPAFADTSSREEATGVGAGAVVGAMAGGPAGAIIGAAIGAAIGDTFHRREEQVDDLNASLEGTRARASDLERSIAALQADVRSKDAMLAEAEDQARPELESLLRSGIATDLLFRTDEDQLADTTTARVEALAAGLTVNPDIRIRLDGFADERGDATYNQGLSVRRAEHVRDILVAAGVPESRIVVNAHGESPAVRQDADSFALERRVSMTLYVEDAPAVASTSPQ